MSTDYDAIAEDYQRAKRQPWRAAIEEFTLLKLVGDLRGLAVLDLACGEGYYTRRLRGLGASRVVGVDRSAGMIGLARAEEAERPLGLEYVEADCTTDECGGGFDLAVAAYLLNYARDRSQLSDFCRSVARAVRPGGRFVAVDTNPDLDLGRTRAFQAYGFEIEAPQGAVEGAPVVWTFHLSGGPLRIENYHLPAAAREDALRAAGFRKVVPHAPRLAPNVEGGATPWGAFLDNPPVIFLECTH